MALAELPEVIINTDMNEHSRRAACCTMNNCFRFTPVDNQMIESAASAELVALDDSLAVARKENPGSAP